MLDSWTDKYEREVRSGLVWSGQVLWITFNILLPALRHLMCILINKKSFLKRSFLVLKLWFYYTTTRYSLYLYSKRKKCRFIIPCNIVNPAAVKSHQQFTFTDSVHGCHIYSLEYSSPFAGRGMQKFRISKGPGISLLLCKSILLCSWIKSALAGLVRRAYDFSSFHKTAGEEKLCRIFIQYKIENNAS